MRRFLPPLSRFRSCFSHPRRAVGCFIMVGLALLLGTEAAWAQTTVKLESNTGPIQVGDGPRIQRVWFVSKPTLDSDGDGENDTFVRSDRILVDVEFNANDPVVIGGDGDVRLHLDLGADDTDPANSRKVIGSPEFVHRGATLRFTYTVKAGDRDADGVWVQTGVGNTVLFTPGTATVIHADTGTAADPTKSGLPTVGNQLLKVDGSKTRADTGPVPTGATVNGDTLTVTFNRNLNTSVDANVLRFDLLVYGAGGIDVPQSPKKAVSVSGATLTLTLSAAARASDTVRLTYDGGLLEDVDGNKAPGFHHLAVTNNSPGRPAPKPLRASVAGKTLRLVFDGALDESSAPQGDAFVIQHNNSQGTGTATVSGETVTVRLIAAVSAGKRVKVSYTKPGEIPPTYETRPEPGGAPLRGAAAGNPEVPSFVLWTVMGHPARLESATTEERGRRLLLTFTKEILTAGLHTDYTVLVDGERWTTKGAFCEDNTIGLWLAEPVRWGETVTVAYAKPSGRVVLRGPGELAVKSFGPVAVTNTVQEPPRPSVQEPPRPSVQEPPRPSVQEPGVDAGRGDCGRRSHRDHRE